MIRTIILIVGTFYFLMHHYSIRADDSVWIYMYSHEYDTPKRVLEVVGDADKFELCEFYRDMLDQAMEAHPSAFHTCVVPADLEKGMRL